MNIRLMHRDRDFEIDQPLPPNAEEMSQDLELDVIFGAMAGKDVLFQRVAQSALLSAMSNGVETIRYRQAVLKDCLRCERIIRRIYLLTVKTIEEKRKSWLGVFSKYPGSILSGSINLLRMFMERLLELRQLAEFHGDEFQSEGFKSFFARLQEDLTDEYFDLVKGHLKTLRFDNGTLVAAQLGEANQGTGYVLRHYADSTPAWKRWFSDFTTAPDTVYIGERDEAGARALTEIRDHGINPVANALAQSADHIQGFFEQLQIELAFYLGCTVLHQKLTQKTVPLCFPTPTEVGAHDQCCEDLRDTALLLTARGNVVGNDLRARGKSLIVVTGANQGGKSTFLRSIGQAQLMMQAGMFTTAKAFSSDIRCALFTHYKREEDEALESGKFDEELKRMSGIVNTLQPDSLLLFNESFSATNEREGSEVASQIVRALVEAHQKVFFVTHQYEFARGFYDWRWNNAIFLRAEREEGGTRTFRVIPGEPLQTSFGADLYERIFGEKEVAETSGEQGLQTSR